MPLLLDIYIWCVIGASFFVLLTNIIVSFCLHNDKIAERYKHEVIFMAWQTWDQALFIYKLCAVFIPLINAVFSILLLVAIGAKIYYWYLNFGYSLAGRFSKDNPNMRYYKLKCCIIHIFFPKLYGYFLTRHLLKTILKTSEKNENKKEEKSKCESEPDSELHSGTGDQETPAARKES